MPTPISDSANYFRATMKMRSYQQSWSEEYWMKANSFATCKADLNCLARWRAAILGRDVVLDYAVVIQQGPARTSRVAVPSPLQGTTGVKFDTTIVNEVNVNVNTPGDGLEVRLEMVNNKHANRCIKGMPDSWINRKKYYSISNPIDVVNFGNYTAVMANTEVPEKNEIFEFAPTTPYTSLQLSKFVNFETALQRFFQAVFNFTVGVYEDRDSEGNPTGSLAFAFWDNFVYRYATSRTVGDPF